MVLTTVIARTGAIVKARRAAGLSLREVAEAAQVSHGMVHHLERGVRAIARDKADRIAAALGEDVRELFVHGDGASLHTESGRCAAVTVIGSRDPDSPWFGQDEYCDADAEPGTEYCTAHREVEA